MRACLNLQLPLKFLGKDRNSQTFMESERQNLFKWDLDLNILLKRFKHFVPNELVAVALISPFIKILLWYLESKYSLVTKKTKRIDILTSKRSITMT